MDAYFKITADIRSLVRFRRLWEFLLQRQEFKGLVDTASEQFQP